jgi:lipid-binding SYLF domain-containing protein
MYRLNQIAALLAGSLLTFGPAAVAQDCNCKHECPGCKQAQCAQQQAQCHCAEQPQTSVQRQKPYESRPARNMAPRNLPTVDESEARLANDAAAVVSESPVQGWIRDARAVAVIPAVKKGAFIFGGRWGRGLMTMRDECDGSWLPPSFIQITGGNFGPQVGFESTDLVLVFTSKGAIQSLLSGQLTLNADASAASPWLGRRAGAGVPVLLRGGIYSWSRTKGVFLGASLDGAVVRVDRQSNERVYGMGISGSTILLDRRVESNASVAPFIQALQPTASAPVASTSQADTEG